MTKLNNNLASLLREASFYEGVTLQKSFTPTSKRLWRGSEADKNPHFYVKMGFT